MATINHGVRTSETATDLVPTVEIGTAVPLVLGTAPVNLLDDPYSAVNVPRLCMSYSEAVGYFGFEEAVATGLYTEDGDELYQHRYTLSEFFKANYSYSGIGTCIFINVLDPSKHNTDIETATVTITDGQAVVEEAGILRDTLTITASVTSGDSSSSGTSPDTGSGSTSTDSGSTESAEASGGSESADSSGGSESTESDGSGELQVITAAIANSSGVVSEVVTYAVDEDFTLAFDEDTGYLVISSVTGDDDEQVIPDGTVLTISGKKIDPSQVTGDDIIGGVSTKNVKSGLELIEECWTRFVTVVTLIVAPYFSKDASVAAAMAAKCSYYDGCFSAMALIDADTEETTVYSDVPSYKSTAGINEPCQVICWPKINFDGTIYNMSTMLTCTIAETDSDAGDFTHCSPSNKSINCTGLILADGSEVVLGMEESNHLNTQGIGTCFNFQNGFTYWGNRTAAYPSNTDIKDSMIAVKRTFFHVRNTITLTSWQFVDEPGNRKLIDLVKTTIKRWLEGHVSLQHLLYGNIEFREEDNTTQNMMDGEYVFKLWMTPPSPAEQIEYDCEIYTSAYESLFD